MIHGQRNLRTRLPGRRPKGQAELKSNPFGSDWKGIRRELDKELTPDKLQSRLKAMTAGDEASPPPPRNGRP